jgi:(1->4)-alpha-D-glucan 1-alpha-D-glucosylmutase
MKAYLIKAVREAKVHTAWLAPDSVYEEAFLAFFTALFADGGDNPFLEQFLPFQRRIAWFGALNSLSQTLLKMTCPGLPDFYQGSELWDLNLVDPDNRRPVDFAARSELLQLIQQREASGVPALARELFSRYQDGGVKLFLIYRTLQARRRDPRLFARGSYTPVGIRGRWKNNLVAFTRRYGGRTALVCAPRFCPELVETGELPLGEKVWADTLLTAPSGIRRWENAITAETLESRGHLPAARLLSCFPAALLLGGSALGFDRDSEHRRNPKTPE